MKNNIIISHLFSFLVNSTTQNKGNYALQKKKARERTEKMMET